MKTITIDRTGDVFVTVDDDDYDWLTQWKWHLYNYRGVQYAKRTGWVRGKRTTIYMHREIAKRHIPGRTKSRKLVDHKNSNGLNNCRDNLRWVTPRQNRHNYNGARWRHMTDLLPGVEDAVSGLAVNRHRNGASVPTVGGAAYKLAYLFLRRHE